jgi:hypothetical protein
MSWKTKVGLVVLGAVLCGGSTVRAQSGDAILDLLTKKGVITQREANDVREQLDQQNSQTVEMYNKQKFASWIDELKWSGDLRIRGEFFDNEDQTSQIDRTRFRYRLRLGLEAKFANWATVGLRLASGKLDDPVSTNETFDDMFAKDLISIDAAYVIIQPPSWDWVSVTVGKMNNPIWQTSLSSPVVYDNDLTPEGLAEQFVFGFGDQNRHSVFVNLTQWVAGEVGSSADTDAFIYDNQVGAELRFGDDVKKPVLRAKLAGGIFLTQNIDASALPAMSPTLGNALQSGSATNYLRDFTVAHARAEIAWQVSPKTFLGTPAVFTVSGEYVKNLTDDFNTMTGANTLVDPDQTEGYSGQIAFGGNKKKGEWQVAYQYKYLEADAVLDALTDSDWGTEGGADRKGHVVKASYNLQDWWQIGATAFLTEKISDRTGLNTMPGNPGDALFRLQVDSVFKF